MSNAALMWNGEDGLAQGVLASLMESSSDVVRIVGLDGRLHWVNGAGRRLLEISDFEALCGRPWASLWPVEARARVTAALAEAADGGRARFEARCPTSAGADRWWETVVTPVRHPGGRVVCLLATSRDITELHGYRAADVAPQPAEVCLQTARHEVMTPLHGLRGMAALLRGTPLSPDQRAMLNSICAGADALTAALAGEAAPEPAATVEPVAAPADGAPLQVLVVDDNEVNRTLLRLAFEAAGVKVTTADDGAEACGLCEKVLFDLVVMDLHMPVMDGLSALRRIRSLEAAERRARTPVVVFTASGGADCERASRAAGADAFLTKPLSPTTLIWTVSPLLEGRGQACAAGGARH